MTNIFPRRFDPLIFMKSPLSFIFTCCLSGAHNGVDNANIQKNQQQQRSDGKKRSIHIAKNKKRTHWKKINLWGKIPGRLKNNLKPFFFCIFAFMIFGHQLETIFKIRLFLIIQFCHERRYFWSTIWETK